MNTSGSLFHAPEQSFISNFPDFTVSKNELYQHRNLMFSLRIKRFIRKWFVVVFFLFLIIFSFCWDHFMVQGKDTESHLGFSGSPETEPGWEWGPRVSWAETSTPGAWAVPQAEAYDGNRRHQVTTHELLAWFLLKESLSCPPVVSCILRASPFCHITVAHTVRNLPAMRETQVWSLHWEDLLEKGMTTHSFFPGEFHGQKILANYSLQSHKESDRTERLTHTHS